MSAVFWLESEGRWQGRCPGRPSFRRPAFPTRPSETGGAWCSRIRLPCRLAHQVPVRPVDGLRRRLSFNDPESGEPVLGKLILSSASDRGSVQQSLRHPVARYKSVFQLPPINGRDATIHPRRLRKCPKVSRMVMRLSHRSRRGGYPGEYAPSCTSANTRRGDGRTNSSLGGGGWKPVPGLIFRRWSRRQTPEFPAAIPDTAVPGAADAADFSVRLMAMATTRPST